MSGSCALNLCGIACGRLDLFYELGFGGPWYDCAFLFPFLFPVKVHVIIYESPVLSLLRDVAAGVVIVEEAGGVVYDP